MTQPTVDSTTVVDPSANESVTGDQNAGVDDTGKPAEGAPEAKPEGEDGLKNALKQERLRANKAEKALRDAELAKLPELERLKSEHAELTKENDKLNLENRQLKIGMKHKLPVSISTRLKGDTDEEMEADAQEMLKHYRADEKIDDGKEKKRPPNDGKSGGKPSTGYDMNKLMRIAAGRG